MKIKDSDLVQKIPHNLPARDVERIKRQNKALNKKIVKFVEAFWRMMFYAIFVVVGIQTLFYQADPDTGILRRHTASWITETMNHWRGWPMHDLTDAIKFYYQVELGAYIHQLFWTEVSRSDAYEMILHHVTTISLIVLSYLTNYTRVGTSILLLHDLADVFLESAKIFNYTSKAKGHEWTKHLCDILFVCFAVTFFATRLVMYPRFIIYSVLFEAPDVFGIEWIGFWVFAGLLVVLQCLHIFWFYLIGKMVYRLITTGIEKDERSDDEEEVVIEGDEHSSIDDKDNDNNNNNDKNDNTTTNGKLNSLSHTYNTTNTKHRKQK